ncbi:MAG TPA: DMT family transporter [Gemmatimonadales bacterium]|nr:DMT family transporter [Gemmatimonadales bacterium]
MTATGARLRLIAAAVMFSTGGAAIKWCGFGAWQTAAGRALVAMWAVSLLVPEARRGWTWRAGVVAFAYAGAGLSFVLANKLTTAASTIFLQATNPLFILALAPWLLHEHVTRREILYMAVLTVGMGFLLSSPGRQFATAPNPALGNMLAVGCSVFWALTVIGYRWLAASSPNPHGAVAAAAATGNGLVFLIALPFALPLAPGRPGDWLVLVYLGVFQLGLAYVFLARGITKVPALEASLVMLVEPVLNPIWAWLVEGETPSAWAVVGGVIILVATGVRAWVEVGRGVSR